MSSRSYPADGRSDPRWPAAVVLFTHFVACLWYFPPREIFSGEPLLTSDYVFHYLASLRVAGYLRGGSFLGYCTTWAAGFPDGFLGMVNGKPFIVALALAGSAARPLVFNLTVFFFLWLFAPAVYAAARSFGRDRREAATATALALFAWYGSKLFRVFWRGGSVLFVTGSAISLWALGHLLRRWSGERTPGGLAAVVVASAIVPWIHPGAALPLILGGVVAYAATFRERGLRAGDLMAIGGTAVAANLPWLWPFIRYADLRRSIAYPIYQGGLDQLIFDLVRAPFHLGALPPVETAVLLPLLCAALVAREASPEGALARRVLIGLSVPLAATAYAGFRLPPLSALEPYRFVIPLALALAILAAPLGRVVAGSGTRAVALVVLLVLADRVRVAGRSGDYLGSGLGATEAAALDALRAAAAPAGRPVEGRVLLEGDWHTEGVATRPGAIRVSYAFVGFEGRIAAEFIGAPLMAATTPEEVASFWKGRLFGRDLDAYDGESFLRLCDLYDIRWVVSLHEETRRKLASFGPAVAAVAGNGPVVVFRVERRRQPLWNGSGTALSDGREIVFSSAGGEPAVLKYHWNRLLAARPGAGIRRAGVAAVSPADFIEVLPPRAGVYTIGISLRLPVGEEVEALVHAPAFAPLDERRG